jgi:hypothetical protein
MPFLQEQAQFLLLLRNVDQTRHIQVSVLSDVESNVGLDAMSRKRYKSEDALVILHAQCASDVVGLCIPHSQVPSLLRPCILCCAWPGTTQC